MQEQELLTKIYLYVYGYRRRDFFEYIALFLEYGSQREKRARLKKPGKNMDPLVWRLWSRRPTKSTFMVLNIGTISLTMKIWGLSFSASSKKPLMDVTSSGIYTVLHIFAQVLFWAGNQGNHQKFRPILATQETLTDFHGDEAKKNSKMANSKINWDFQFSISPWFSAQNNTCVNICNTVYIFWLKTHQKLQYLIFN